MIAMMIFIHLIILLTIGFGVGYWLLITANKHEGRLKTIGESLGYVLLVTVILYVILGFFYSMKISDSDYMPGIGQQKSPMEYKEENEEQEGIQKNEKNPMMDNEKSEENEETQEGPNEYGNKPMNK